MTGKFACYLIDARNDGKRSGKTLTFHRMVIKREQKSLDELVSIGNEFLSKHPECNRLTIAGSGRKLSTQWLYDSSGKFTKR